MKLGGTMSGFAELDARLAKLPTAMRPEIVTPALMAGGEVIAEEARVLVPVRSGNLRDSITVGTEPLNSAAGGLTALGETVNVGPAQGKDAEHDGFYGHMIEFGTKHAAAEPFMRPAFDSKKDEAFEVIADRICAEIDRIAKG